jgi:hypothetical protein
MRSRASGIIRHTLSSISFMSCRLVYPFAGQDEGVTGKFSLRA